MSQNVIQPSFAGGELSSKLYGRVDMAQYRIGCRKLQNFFVHPAGGVSNRPGTEFVGEIIDSTTRGRLIPFQFSTQQTYVLEFGDRKLRIIRDGGYVLETPIAITGILQSDPVTIQAANSFAEDDDVYLSGIAGMTRLNNRRFKVSGATSGSFQLRGVSGADLPTYGGGGTAARVYTVASPYAASDLRPDPATNNPGVKYTQSADVMTFCHPSYPPYDLSRTGDAAWSFAAVSFAPQVARPTGLALSIATGGSTTYRYKVTAVNADDTEESLPGTGGGTGIASISKANPAVLATTSAHGLSTGDEIYVASAPGMAEVQGRNFLVAVINATSYSLRKLDNSNVDSTSYGTYTGGGAAYAVFARTTGAAVLSSTNTITVSWASQAGVSKYNVYREVSGTFGIISSTLTNSFKDENIKPDTTDTPPSARDPFADKNWPGTVAYHEQRKFFANSMKQPQTLWATQSGNFKNMNVASPTKDDDAITRTLLASQVNAIRHMVSMNVLILLTSGAEWKCFGGSSNDAITPANCYTKPQSYNGCCDIQPIVSNNSILFIQEKGSVVRDIGYEFASDSYTGTDCSVMSDHLFYGHTIQEWAFSQEPFRVVWAVRDDGVVLGLTYMKEQKVLAWHRQVTDGQFESVAAISEGGEDAAYFIVNRMIDGESRRYVERLHTRQFGKVEDAWFLDCALGYSGPPTQTVSNLDHLEGKVVGVLGDGNVFPSVTVTGGEITLDNPASKIIIGLPYTAELETLDLDVGDPTIQGKRKKISAVTVKVENTRGLKVGGVYESGQPSILTEVKERSNQMYGTPIGLLTGNERVLQDPSWNSNGRVLVRQDNPLPCTILAVIPEVDLGA